jgi:hypothetical protein
MEWDGKKMTNQHALCTLLWLSLTLVHTIVRGSEAADRGAGSIAERGGISEEYRTDSLAIH